jgi:Uma2 family endonuclease
MAMPRLQEGIHAGARPLNSGDQLSLGEFQRLSAAHPEIKKAELIDGTVFIETTVGSEHANVHKLIMTLLGVYESRHPEAQGLDNGSVLISGSEVQPDSSLRLRKGGASEEAGVIVGPPELAVEVSASSYAYDSTLKRRLYERSGVREYLLLQLYEQRVEWWTLDSGKYRQIAANDAGIYESEVFPGLRLDAAALWAGDMAGVLAAL